MSQPNPERPDLPRLPSQLSASHCPVQKKRTMPLYKVVLLQSGIDDLMFIVRSVMELTRFPRAEATHKMWEGITVADPFCSPLTSNAPNCTSSSSPVRG